ncbi:MAG: acetyl esterase/lipase [Polyangiales bacterium]|jgi:acetyl esterase/lipase
MLASCGSANAPELERADAAVDAAPDTSLDASSELDADFVDADGSDLEPNDSCDTPGCLRSATFVGDFTQDDLEPFLEAGVRINNGYSVWTLSYATEHDESLATVTIPFRARAPFNGYHIVGNNHGTTGIGEECGLTGTIYGTGLAGLFGARGMVGVAPDYPGLGTTGDHPYLVAESEGRAVLDSLRAAEQLSRWLDVPLSGHFATTGLSQGGHATIAAAMEHETYAPELDIRAFSAAAPASAWIEHWRPGASFDGEHLVYHALLFGAWTQHYAYDGPSLWAPDFDVAALSNACIFNIRDNEVLGRVVPVVRSELFNAEFLSAYSSGNWGEYGTFAEHFAANRIVPFRQTAPLRIYQGDDDETVLEADTAQMVEALRGGGVAVEYEVVEGGTHLNVAFGFVATDELRTEESITWLRSMLDAP